MPAWRLVDPLPILASLKEQDERGDGESLASLVENEGSNDPPPSPNPGADEDVADNIEQGD